MHILYELLETEPDGDSYLNAGVVAGIGISTGLAGGVCGAGGSTFMS